MKYLKIALLSYSVFVFGNLSGQDSGCLEKFRTGTFQYETGGGEKVIIYRTKRKQTEVFNNGKSKLILKIKWLNDSTYLLIQKKAVNAPGCLKKGDIIKTRVVSCEGERFTCEYSSERCGKGKSVFLKLE